MATVKYGSLPSGYPLNFEANPPLDFILGNSGDYHLEALTSTRATYEFDNGMSIRINGTGFTKGLDGDLDDTGTISSIQVFASDGKTVLQTITTTLKTEAFVNAVNAFDAQGNLPKLAEWLFNKADTFTGTAGDDEMYGFGGDDIMNGGAGVDYIQGGEGKDTYDGGAGIGDQLSFQDAYFNANAYRGIALDVTKGTVIDPWGNNETFKNFESFRGSQFADNMKGSAADEAFMGLGGKDVIDGGGGFDIVRYHRDVNRGGDKGVTVDLAKGYAIDGFGKTDTLLNIEGARGTQFKDTFTGSTANNTFWGDNGDDTFNGGLGNDILNGGAGKDTFIFNSVLNSTKNVDQIQGYVVADDIIRLENAIFTKLTGVNVLLTADQFVANTSGEATDTKDRIIYESDTGNIYYDADGSTKTIAKVLFAHVDAGLKMTAGEFFIF
ncbi:calcium-binding protein [Rhizobium sp. XQZ8]|uniref:calcium-binding protein n=1 Tax=Rhizobium populisoli TaxID=2859785 RepID=UPI001CA54F1B|nr:calcium-binding protein [Rhizobium populisoli]MBW6425266.1 calcium-binding protein [Rhizobium populisoli]